MSATNGDSFVEGPCGGDLTHGGSPRYFLSSVAGTTVMPDDFLNSELVASDEDCAQILVISDAASMRFSNLPHWSPDGLKIAVYGEHFALPSGPITESGIFIADVVRTAGRPTGIANLYLAIPSPGEVLISWSGDSQRIAYVGSAPNGSDGQQADIFIYDLGADVSVNVTNTSNVNEDHPAYSPASERIAFIRLMTVRGTYRYDIFTIPASGGTASQVTTKGTTGAAQNLFPCFSPDGQYLSFSSGSTLFAFDIYRIRSDGSGKAVNLTGKRTGSFRYNLCADGRLLEIPRWEGPDGGSTGGERCVQTVRALSAPRYPYGRCGLKGTLVASRLRSSPRATTGSRTHHERLR